MKIEQTNFGRPSRWKAIGLRLREEQLLAGWSEEKLGASLGVAGETIQRYELGECRIDPHHLVIAAGVVGMPLAIFSFCGDNRPSLCDNEMVPPRVGVARPLSVLGWPSFAPLRPLVKLWRASRGCFSEEMHRAVTLSGLRSRMVVARQSPGSSRLITEYLGAGHRHLHPCETLLLLGRDLHERPDLAYGAWVADAYAAASWHREISIEAVRAQIRTSDGKTIHGRYDRLLLPWRDRSDVFVLGVSLRRAVSVTP